MAFMAWYGNGWRTGFLVVLVALSFAGAPAAALAEPQPRFTIKYSYFSETVQPGQLVEVKAPCPKGQTLLSTSILPRSTGVGLGRPEVPLLVSGIQPAADGASVGFGNSGARSAEAEVGVACIKAKGADIEVDVVKDQVTFSAPGSAVTSQKCKQKGAIPGEVGFYAAAADLTGVEYFESKGDIGARLGFNGITAGSRAEMRMLCLRAEGVKLTGRLVGDQLGATGPVREGKGRVPKLQIDYGSEPIASRSDLSNAGAGVFAGEGGGTPWTGPYPGPPGGEAYRIAGLGSLQPAAARSQAEATGFVFVALLGESDEEAAAARMRAFHAMVVTQGKAAAFDEMDFADEGGPTGEDGKTVRPFQGAMTIPNCSPGFFVDVFIDADAQVPSHSFLENGGEPPCPNATVEVTRFPAGTQPPGSTDPAEDWRTHQTYRIQITSPTSATPSPPGFAIHVFWIDPSP